MSDATPTLLGERYHLLHIEKGDVLVIRSPDILSQDVAMRLHRGIKNVLSEAGHPDTPVLILGEGMGIEVIRHKDANKLLPSSS